MKRHLFYSLLLVFLATTAVTLAGVIGVCTVKEPYLGALVTAFLVEGAGVTYTIMKRADFFAPDPIERAVKVEQPSQGPFDREKIAQIFWLGADLHSLIWHLTVTADADKIRFYLKQANSHMRAAGLNGHPLQEIMGQLYQEGSKISPSEWTPAVRTHYVQSVSNLLTKIVALIEHQQGPSFIGEAADDPKAAAARDSAAIYEFLRQSKAEGKYTFRNTAAISSHTRIPESRVVELASLHPKIRRNEKERQSWCLDE